ncbi:hypothetical protein VCR19J5_1210443 [Vibrio crassostreae]|nr:hypothetical protein VCR19J5_1210443 [Vibrio crassostreae]
MIGIANLYALVTHFVLDFIYDT